MPMPQPRFRTPKDYEAIRHLVTDEQQLFDTFEEWLDAAEERFEKFIAKGITVKKVFVDPQEHTRLYRNQEIPEERCWVRGSGWCLAYS